MKAIVLINGAGLGNSVRMLEVIKSMHKHGIETTICCSGRAIDYFSYHNIPHIKLNQLEYSVTNGNLDILKTLSPSSIKKNWKRFKDNEKILAELNQNNKFDFCFIDSFYNIKNFNHIPKFGLNNSDLLFFNNEEAYGDFDIKSKLHFHFIEKNDFFFHRNKINTSFSPTFFQTQESKGFVHTGLISRHALKEYQEEENNLLLMLSGAGWRQKMEISQLPVNTNNLFVVGIPPDSVQISGEHDKIHLIGSSLDNIEYVNKSKIAIINAGFSAISEMVKTKKPMVLLPLSNHSEQIFNAKMVQKLGLGLIANEDNWKEKTDEVLNNFDYFKSNFDKLPKSTFNNGEDDIVKYIISYLESKP